MKSVIFNILCFVIFNVLPGFAKILNFTADIDKAVIITGGKPDRQSVEVLRGDITDSCNLPNLPDIRDTHSQSGLVTCGSGYGGFEGEYCVTFSEGEWFESHRLLHSRAGHCSWSSQAHGTFLIGGYYGSSSSELLTDNGESQESFPLKYSTRYQDPLDTFSVGIAT